jgi:DNA (cytosine-5)-methyltransferase 1
MRHGSLFSGIGGFDLAAQWMGWENVFHCEWNEFGQKVLKHYWPNAESFTDITKSDFTKYANTIDILTGGFPCQPYSLAGKRKGKEDERHLFPEMLRAIREIQPRWVVGENVFGLVNWSGGLVFHEVQADLEAEGYEVFPYVLPACAKNAPHRRDRVWFVAHSNSCADLRRSKENAGEGCKEWLQERNGVRKSIKSGNIRKFSTNTGNQGLQRGEVKGSIAGSGKDRDEQPARFLRTNWQEFPTQSPLCNGDDGISSRLDTTTLSFSKWRNESIKAGGNAIVPQVAYEIFKAIEQYENL